MATARLHRRIVADFGDAADDVEQRLMQAADSERVQAAIVLWAAGDPVRLADSIALARVDWRDCLIRADLANEDWPERLDAALGPAG